MLKEQLFGFAVNALARAYEVKEEIKKNLKSEIVQNYVKVLRRTVLRSLEKRLVIEKNPSEKLRKKSARSQSRTRPKKVLKTRKSSIRQAKEIRSDRAETIFSLLKDEATFMSKNEELNAKKSLACLIWALGQAERAQVSQGISVHDVSALLYKAHNINLYPINISRVVHSNEVLVRQAGQANRTKTYVLTDQGMKMFNEKFL